MRVRVRVRVRVRARVRVRVRVRVRARARVGAPKWLLASALVHQEAAADAEHPASARRAGRRLDGASAGAQAG